MRQLAADMDAGNVGMLIVIGANPVYDAPADLDFAKKMEKVGLRIHLGLYQDETSWLSHWHLPMSHALESWGDARAFDGTTTIVQPLIAPLYDSKSVHELLAMMMDASPNGYEIVRNFWKERLTGDFEKSWQIVLNDGLVKPEMMKSGVTTPAATPAPAPSAPATPAADTAAPAP
ncbi:MAG: molybdopterin oxidoreductase, iron-sulfur binding subunit, partial [Chlorobi bacterium OLB7]